MSAGDYLGGAFFLLVTYGAVFAATEVLVRRRLAGLRGVTRTLAWAVLATAGLIGVHLLPALVGGLSRETALVCALALFVAVTGLLAPVPAAPHPPRPTAPPSTALERALAAGAIVACGVWLLLAMADHLTTPSPGFDALSAYMPTVATWIDRGSIWEIADWVPNAFFGAGPGNGSLIVLSATLPWSNDFLSHLAMYPYVVLVAIALYALARELGAPGATAVLLALMVTAVPVVVQPGLTRGLLDPLMYSMLAIGVVFLIRHDRSEARADLILAGLALGICFGTKFYGYTVVAAIAAIWVVARLIRGSTLTRVARELAVLGGLILAAGGVWMVRNWVETGNPLLPLTIDPLGFTLFEAPADPQRSFFGFTIADYLAEPEVWRDTLAHQFRIAAAAPLVVLAATTVGAMAMLIRRRGAASPQTGDGVAVAVLVAVVVAAALYAITPYTGVGAKGDPSSAAVNVRYGVPAMILAVGVAGWLAARLPERWRLALGALAVLAAIDALRVGNVTTTTAVYVAFAVGAVVAVVWLRRGVRLPRLPSPSTRALAIAVVALVAIAVPAGQLLQDRFNRDRYVGEDPALDEIIRASDFRYDRAGTGFRIGLAGHWALGGAIPTYPSFGTRLQNDVTYLGPVDDGLLLAPAKRREFRTAMREARPDALVIGTDYNEIAPEGRTPARARELERWARDAGFVEVRTASERFVLMRRDGAS
ncbi:MAG TPA: glycosyltransferase family 39 protein [Solirubrobacterales bacterium]|nr:glycosyltransferase family 39 protein [Solirubrobacterales bacterium]